MPSRDKNYPLSPRSWVSPSDLTRKSKSIRGLFPGRLVQNLDHVAKKYGQTREYMLQIMAEDWLREHEMYSTRLDYPYAQLNGVDQVLTKQGDK